jgi:hypothetical protein
MDILGRERQTQKDRTRPGFLRRLNVGSGYEVTSSSQEASAEMSGARVVDYIPLFVHRFARERLRALAKPEEPS